MNNETGLLGTLVLIHPDVRDDALQMQGKPGMIADADLPADNIFVTFGNGRNGLYSSNCLLAMKNAKEIFGDLMAHAKDMPVAEFKTLFQVSNLLDTGTSEKTKEAMKLVAEHPGIIPRAMVSLDEKLGMVIAAEPVQEMDLMLNRGR